MSAQGVHKITADFEQALCDYTGSPYAIALDNQSNALFLALKYLKVEGMEISIPARTYPSVPCEIKNAGAKVKFLPVEGETLTGSYQLIPTCVYDSALRFTADMYEAGTMQCVSFTGAYKHLKLSKGGAILLDNQDAYKWLKRARFSGRNECSYHTDYFDFEGGWNFYMMPELAARGLLLMGQFYNTDGSKKTMPDTTLPYPDLSLHPAYK